MKTIVIGKPAVSTKEKLQSLSKDVYMSFMGRLDVDNKIILKKLLTEYCIFSKVSHIDITSKEILELIKSYHKIDNQKEEKIILTEISRRISGSESYELSGNFETIMKNGKQVRRNGAILRKFTPESDAFVAKNTLDI